MDHDHLPVPLFPWGETGECALRAVSSVRREGVKVVGWSGDTSPMGSPESLNAGGPSEGTTEPRPDAKEGIASATHAGCVRCQ